MPLNTAFLRTLSYRDGKGQMEAVFESAHRKFKRAFEFAPEIRLPLNSAVYSPAREIVSPHEGLVFSRGRGRCAIHGKSFSQLRKAHALLSLSLKASIPLPEPERQFLLSRNWHYFDRFIIGEEGISKENNAGESWLSIEVPGGISFNDAFLSRMLSVPLSSLSHNPGKAGRLLLENWAFSEGQLIYAGEAERRESKPEGRIFHNFVELDFSRALLRKIADSNLGFESMNCGCCRPESPDAGNVLPNSMVEVEFKENGYYFDSMLPSFSLSFHQANSGKQARIERKREFCLEHYPVGPFYAGQTALVPLADARELEGSGSAVVRHGKEQLKWCCGKHKSFLANGIEWLLSLEHSARERAVLLEKIALREKGLNAFNPCFEGTEKRSLSGLVEASGELIDALFSCILRHNLCQGALCGAVEAFNSGLLHDYNNALEQRHSEQIYSHAGRAFIRDKQNFTDLAVVSRETGIPMPSPY